MLLLLSSLVFVLLLLYLYPQETDAAFTIQKGTTIKRYVNDNKISANFLLLQNRYYSQTIYHRQRNNIIQLSIRLKSSKRISVQVSATKEEEEEKQEQEEQQQQQEESTQEQKHCHRRKRISILVCPAQFCVPDDYTVLFDNLRSYDDNSIEIGTCVVCQLPRTEWIKVAKQLPTKDFIQGTLNVPKTLDWYFTSIETAATTIFSTELVRYGTTNPSICIIGHSIGGWVARAYLGGMSQSSTSIYPALVNSCTSLITLGTPHSVSNTAIVDQTRGLINSIDSTPTCTPQYLVEQLGIDITCVGSNGIRANVFTTDIEQLIAVASYVPLLGLSVLLNNHKNNSTTATTTNGNDNDNDNDTIKTSMTDGCGDGIVPIQLAFLREPSNSVIVEKCLETNDTIRHSHVVPTPWNLWNGYEPSIPIPYPSYVTKGVVSQWAKYIK